MKKLGRKALALSLSVVMGTSLIMTGCGSSKDGKATATPEEIGVTTKLSQDVKGDISIMVWSGDGEYYEDIANNKKFENPKNIKASNVAIVYAVAKEFKKAYPNVKINLWSKAGDPDQPDTPSWEQEMENFKNKYKKYPDIWGSTDVIRDMKKGLVADLSVYADDELYKAYNPTLMENLNYYGFQAGLPSYTIPGGIWINKALAENKNIPVPDVDWNIDEFTRFISKADGKTYWGMKGIPQSIINIGTESINKMISEENKVDLESKQVRDLLEYAHEWSLQTVDTANGAGNLSAAILTECSNYSWYFFSKGYTLVNFEDPWYLTAGADEKASKTDTYINSTDWDMYPYPSTDYCDNTVKVIMDPICIHNYAGDDGNTEWSKEEKAKRDLTYTFASFWTASTQAKQAIYDQQWSDNGQLKSACGDTFPVVQGKLYDEQMKIWNKLPAHKVYKDKEGFQKILEIWQNNQTWDYIDKCWYSSVTEEGQTTRTLYEWEKFGDETIAGVWATDESWVNNVKSRLKNWNKTCNKRIETATQQLKDALKKYYGYTDADFK